MGFEIRQVAGEAGAPPVAGVERGQHIQGGGHRIDADIGQGIGEPGAPQRQVLQQQQEAVTVMVIAGAQGTGCLDGLLAAQIPVEAHLVGVQGPGQLLQVVGQFDQYLTR